MQYKKYDTYKDSEAPWIGTVPSHWDVKKIGQCFQHRKEKVSDKDFEPLSVTMQGIVPQLETAAKSDSGDDRKKVCVGDFVINSRSDRKGSSGVSPLDGSVSLISIILKPLIHDKGYIHHLLRSFEFQEEFYRNGKGIVADLWSTKYSEMKNIKVPLPSPEEQKAIAEFIDKKTSQIDTHIDKQERLIALLKERRTAIINKAVTRGLDENVKLKDSGIDWLGEIPEHWDVKKLKFILKKNGFIRGPFGSALKTDTFVSSGYKVYEQKNAIKKDLSLGASFINKNKYKELSRFSVKSHDFLMSCSGTIGKLVYIDSEFEEGIINQAMLIMRINDIYLNEYFMILFESDLIQNRIIDNSLGSAMKNLVGSNIFKNMLLPIPTHQEQRQIVEYISDQTSKIDNAIATIKKEIASLKEYRQSLISNTVTGKIRVI